MLRNSNWLLLALLLAVALGWDLSAAPPSEATGASAVSAGGSSFACSLNSAGGVKCWGYNGHGELGNGTTTNSSVPVDVTSLTSGVAAISAGGGQACAVTIAGGVKCWGYNGFGELGNGSTANSSTAVDVTGLTGGVTAVSSGYGHTCAVTTAGGVKCWGEDDYGQLGNGTTVATGCSCISAPVDVTGLTSGAAAVSVGHWHTCALTTGGGIKCWGFNAAGELGNGAPGGPDCGGDCHAAPVNATVLTGSASSVSAGTQYTCAITSGGGAKCWGVNEYGQFGNGTGTGSLSAVDAMGLTSGAAAVSTGYDHTCALTTAGGVKCSGDNTYGQLGDGVTGGPDCAGHCSFTPVNVTGLTSGGAAVSASGTFDTCALTSGGSVKCCGYNVYGQLGNGGTTDSSTPVLVGGVKAVGGIVQLPDVAKRLPAASPPPSGSWTPDIVASAAIALAVIALTAAAAWRARRRGAR